MKTVKSHSTLPALMAIVVASIFAGNANADMFTFTSPTIQTGGPIVSGSYFEENGFRFEGWTDFSSNPPSAGSLNVVADELMFQTGGVGVVIERIGGGLFDLASLDMRTNSGNFSGLFLATSPTAGPLGEATGWAEFDPGTGALATYSMKNGFDNVSRLWIGSNSSSTQNVFVDNFDLNISAVPEPAFIALMGLGLAGVAFRRRRKS